jgi:hypothetical protein
VPHLLAWLSLVPLAGGVLLFFRLVRAQEREIPLERYRARAALGFTPKNAE